jgi:hypothetical protein
VSERGTTSFSRDERICDGKSPGQRWLGVAGLVFLALVIVSVATSTNISSHASAAQVVASAQKHKTGLKVGAVFIGFAVFEGLFYFWYLREYLCQVAANRQLATIAFAGVILFAVSGTVAAGLRFSMGDVVGHADPVVLQALNVLQNDLNNFMGGAGAAVFLIANGIATIRNGPLPTWVGWVAVVLGVLGAVVGAPAVALWLLIASIVILNRSGRAAPAPAA